MSSAVSASKPALSGVGAASPDDLQRLRDRFITDPAGTDLSSLRAMIARSWKRSLRTGVDPAQSPLRETRAPQLDDRVVESAESAMRKLLDGVAADIACIGLADSRGTLAALRGSATARRWADDKFTVGCSMSEDVIGTNCVGTALEDGCDVVVRGAEHFIDGLRDAVCLAAPVRDALRGSVRAVLLLAMPVASAIDDLRGASALLDNAACEVADVLAVRAAPREHALLMAYLREMRKRGAGAVVAIDGRTTLASQEALELLSAQDYSVLSAFAQQSARSECRLTKDVVLASERTATVFVEPVFAGRERAGSVLQVRVAGGAVTPVRPGRHGEGDPFAAFVGESAALRRALDLAHTASARDLPAHIVGEPGTGKRMLATALAAARAEEVIHLDLHGASHLTQDDMDSAASALDRGAALVLTRVDALQGLAWHAIAKLLEARFASRVFMTARRLSDSALAVLASTGSMEIVMPGLEARREDVPSLVAQCLADTGAGPRRVSPRLVRLFTEATFARNVSELREIVARAAVRCAGGELTTDDLTDEDRRALMRIALSPLQTAEAEQIREALRRANGNRVRAAAILKIGRSTLYRRLDAYARLGFDLEAEVPGGERPSRPGTASVERAAA